MITIFKCIDGTSVIKDGARYYHYNPYGKKLNLLFVKITENKFGYINPFALLCGMENQIKFIAPENISIKFDTDKDYFAAQSTGFIDTFEIARIAILHPTGEQWHLPMYSREALNRAINQPDGYTVLGTYQDQSFYEFPFFNDYEN